MVCRASWQDSVEALHAGCRRASRNRGDEGGGRPTGIKFYLRTLVVAASSFLSFELVRGPAKIVVFTGLRDKRGTGLSLVLRCGLTGTYSAGAEGRLAVREFWCGHSHFKGVGDDPEESVKSNTQFPPSAAHPHWSLRSPSDLFVLSPGPLCLHRSHDSRAVFVRLISYPFPGLWRVRLSPIILALTLL